MDRVVLTIHNLLTFKTNIMKGKFLLLVLIFFSLYSVGEDYMYCDFETSDLNFKTNNDLVYEVVANPVSGGINTSAHCGKVVSAGGMWELIYSDAMDKFIDFEDGKVFKMKVYSPRAGVPVYFKVEGGAPAKELQNVTTTVANEWEELTFDFSDLDPQTMVYNKFVILFDAGQEGSGETFYFDEITGPDAKSVTIPETNFISYCNFDDSKMNFSQANTSGDMQYDVVENPYKSSINTSDSCGVIVTTEDNYELLISDDLPEAFNFAEYGYKFKMKVYAPTVGNVYFKVQNQENNANKEAQVYCPVANQWHELEFDFADLLPASGVMTKIILLFDANSGIVGDTWYFDDIQGPGESNITSSEVVLSPSEDLFYPNPVVDEIKFYNRQVNSKVSLLTIDGKQLYSGTVNGNSLPVSNLNLKSGLYIIRVDDKAGKLLKK